MLCESKKNTDFEIDDRVGKNLVKNFHVRNSGNKQILMNMQLIQLKSGSVPLFQINQSIEVQLYSSKATNICEIAVKRLLGHASDSDRLDFFKEIEIMKKLEYNLHIVSMYGYVASRFVPLMVLEYCELGDIRHYVADNEESLKKNQNGIKELTSYAWQICDGMVLSKNDQLRQSECCEFLKYNLCIT
ncbi:hypothetical protein WR25_22896 [Diploscapter pachys]|uniref:Tyrosine-protein kinase catalytic domain-containing protein n=1 Tax=Diploscapter pachys TaxID=2018661 RepID=A0A2A2KTN4_9BILA|nr:hypothetical protein WR25_22896 [Diploscapter pachys]